MIGSLKAVNRTAIFQSGAKVIVPAEDGSSYEILFVPSSCQESKQLEFTSRSDPSDLFAEAAGPYAELVALGNGWYYALEWR